MTLSPARPAGGVPAGAAHLDDLARALDAVRPQVGLLEAWGRRLADVLADGGRLLAAGNGGSAAQAQHLTAELVGRYEDERPALSAVALHADTSSLTAIANDYGSAEIFRRQVQAHGRPGDVLVVLSTSGASGNVVAAQRAARGLGLTVWALTGPARCPVAAAADATFSVPAAATSTVQELHLAAVHVLCAAVDRRLRDHRR